MLWKGFYQNLSTKKASASGGFAPDPHQGALPPGPRGSFAPLTIYPGATPVLRQVNSKLLRFTFV